MTVVAPWPRRRRKHLIAAKILFRDPPKKRKFGLISWTNNSERHIQVLQSIGIDPGSKHATEQSEGLEHEIKQVRESLISAYEKNIATRLKVEVCRLEANNYNITKDACATAYISSSNVPW
ncbi:hypothetical protein JHK82_021411 [Glycine max]|uniref:Uncharacterized protein n=1 Tax=Glycine max TaxID=3847 RepID=A0A0R0IS60_SOYBN|nr:uncharacterized protein LOC100804777 isoform X2 [Glycine max]XP_028245074.1 uncharacterized protein LOC114422754 isoform X2 [Glycine soja]KAG5000252.1 hypothetical protein JHK87_021324 [Glycine soja]KAG5015731.1 hypothetical protein JHK85_021867 [Glycine max]KAG5025512.1 hypothetical protein JHK86_021426 [Glycine max]KAG5136680.1 hypothetical protein JHK82_021411 [Glycine max]KAH1051282.1 hypothetical protein GYH30_021283 [Glycine max]|eukprot:XP_006585334.1 uncharacterized protein LOC100804777 isoform X2 [Glycine max]